MKGEGVADQLQTWEQQLHRFVLAQTVITRKGKWLW